MTNIRWKDKSDIGTLASGDRMPVTDVSDSNIDKYTTPAEIATYTTTTTDFQEKVEDIIGTKVVGGTNITVSYNDTSGETTISTTSGSGDVVGPASASDNAIARYDGTTGKLVQNSSAFIADDGSLGLGTSNPQAKEHLNSSGTNVALKLTNTSTGTGATDGLDIIEDGLDAYIYNRENGSVFIGTNGVADRVEIDNSGNITANNLSGTNTGDQDLSGYMTKAVYDNANIAEQVVGTTATQDVSNKTLKNTDRIEFDTTPTSVANAEGIAIWNSTDKCLDIYDGTTKLQVGQEMHVVAYNNTGSTILNGKAVYISGAFSNRPTIALAKADSPTTSDAILGIATQDILDGGEGKVTVAGLVNNLDTSSFSAGDAVYLSATTAGELTSTQPQSPNWLVHMGHIINVNATTGSIFVDPNVITQTANSVRITSGVGVTEMNNVQDFFRHSRSTGVTEGCEITNNGDGTVSIASGEGLFRTTDADDGVLIPLVIPAQANIVLNDIDVNYLYVNYNGGTPIWVVTTTMNDFNGLTKVIGFKIARDGNTLNILDLRKINVDSGRKARRQNAEWDGYAYQGFYRSILGTSVISHTGTRNISVAAGRYWHWWNLFTHGTFNTSVSDTFTRFYNRSSYTKTTGLTQVNNSQYDNAGTLTAMNVNRYRADDWFIVLGDTTPYLVQILGDQQFNAESDARTSPFPATLPQRIDGACVYLGRTTIQQGASSFTAYPAGSINLSTGTPSDINSIGGTPLLVSNGGTGATTLTGVVIGNGTSAFTNSATKSTFNSSLSDDDFAFIGTANIFTSEQTINKNSGALTAVTGEVLHKGQADGTAAIDVTDAFGGVPTHILRRANGTNASKTDIVDANAIGRYEFRGYVNGAYTTARGRLEGVATENWSSTANGMAQDIYTTENGTTTMTKKARFDHDGKLNMKQIAPSTNPESGFNSLYFKSDDKLYKRTSAGVETEVGGGGAGGLTRDIWYSLTGTYASTSTFTTTEASNAEATRLAGLAERSLFTCTDSAGTTRRIGYIKSATASTTTITYTVVTDTDLASGDKDFRITPNIKVDWYRVFLSPRIPGEQIADASNSQGIWEADIDIASYLLPVNSSLLTAASGTGAACAWNIYSNSTNLFTSAQDMTTNSTFNEKRPNTNTISAGVTVSARVTSVGGATTKPQGLQLKLFLVPQTLYTSQS